MLLSLPPLSVTAVETEDNIEAVGDAVNDGVDVGLSVADVDADVDVECGTGTMPGMSQSPPSQPGLQAHCVTLQNLLMLLPQSVFVAQGPKQPDTVAEHGCDAAGFRDAGQFESGTTSPFFLMHDTVRCC